ncbi:ComF family protein [Parvularcula maris]|nr:ComF family protein [Parvularcula maris]
MLFPPRCPLTGDKVEEPGRFSAAGWGKLSLLAPPWCEACGATAVEEAPLCASCAAPERYSRNLTGRGRLDAVRSAMRYSEASAGLVLELKYADRHDIAATLARPMAPLLKTMATPQRAMLVPVPLHPKRLAERRYNQALLLAAAIARHTGHAVASAVLRRKTATSPQKGLSVEGRYRNVASAFAANGSVTGQDIVLVDDVLTSGATLIGCAKALRRAGARSVRAVTAARVFPGTEGAQMELP